MPPYKNDYWSDQWKNYTSIEKNANIIEMLKQCIAAEDQEGDKAFLASVGIVWSEEIYPST